MKIPLKGRAGMKIRAGDGREELGVPEILSSPLFYQANPGDRLILSNPAYKFNVATYRPEIEPRWVYTYDYAPDQSWTIYNRDLSGNSYRQTNYVFSERAYFRVCLRKINGEYFDGTEDINDILIFESSVPVSEVKPYIKDEGCRVAECVDNLREDGDLVFLLMTDTHYSVNGTWNDTRDAIKLLSDKIKLDGIIHLGDLTDGMVTGDATRHYVKTVMDGLKTSGVPVWLTMGNHDSNYFRNNPERFSVEEQKNIYFNGKETKYYIDFPNLRLIFLDSFDADEQLRYGYSNECARFLEYALSKIPTDSKALILSHLPPVTRLQYWAKFLRGEAEITKTLNRHADKILAWVNGHNHADMLDNNEGFPIISISNSKCEAYTEKKIDGSVTPDRRLGDTSQELFDILIINARKETARFVRFGAGRDKIISERKAEWI